LQRLPFTYKVQNDFQVPAQRLTKSAFWAQVDEERFASQNLVENLIHKFGTKPLTNEKEVLIIFNTISIQS